jgi:hypothetical protein
VTPDQVRVGPCTFTAGATRLAGLVPRLLGWRPDDVWRATPAELAAIFAAEAEADGGALLTRTELDNLLEQDRHGR